MKEIIFNSYYMGLLQQCWDKARNDVSEVLQEFTPEITYALQFYYCLKIYQFTWIFYNIWHKCPKLRTRIVISKISLNTSTNGPTLSPKITFRESLCILLIMSLDLLEQNTQVSGHFGKIGIPFVSLKLKFQLELQLY